MTTNRTYDIGEAIIGAHDTSTNYFIGVYDNYLIVISNNISIWSKEKLVYRILFDYEFCDRMMNFREDDEAIQNLMLYPQNEQEELIVSKLFKITYKKYYDIEIPNHIKKFDKDFSILLKMFDELSVLIDDFGMKNYNGLKFSFFDQLFDNDVDIKSLLKYAKKIRRIYTREIARR